MIRTYLKIALRNFIKDRFFSVINIAGLSVGIAVVLLIGLYILQEVSYDKFHSKSERIYRIVMHLEMGGNAADLNATFPPMAKAMKETLPEVEDAIRIYSRNGLVFKQDEKVFSEDDVLFADPNFFGVFDFQVLSGDPKAALIKRGQVLLTPVLVKKYFNTEDLGSVVGESISIDQELYEITGVVAPAPSNSHFHYTAITSMESTPQGRDEEWNNMNLNTYVLLKEGARIDQVVSKITTDIFEKRMEDFGKLPERGVIMQPIAQAVTDIHLHSNVQGELEPNSSVMNLYVFGSVGIIVLLLACVNFVNLVTARSANRAKEVGVRKVLGSASMELIRQFTLESVGMVMLSTLLALGIVELLRRPFNALSGKSLPFDMLMEPQYMAALVIFVILLGILAGSYPAFFLSRYKPSQVLKGKVRSGFKNSGIRNVLVTVQFVISIALISCTVVVQHQLGFMRSKKLGFDKENVLVIDNANRLPAQQAFVHSLKALSSVGGVGAAEFMPVDDYDGMPLTTEEDRDNRKLVNISSVDHDFISVMKYELLKGRNFSREIAADSDAVVLNERAAAFMFGEEALDKKVYFDGTEQEFRVIGIVRDFNFESLRNEVRPMVFFLGTDERYLHVRLNPGDFRQTISTIEGLWKRQTSDIPFSYVFLDDEYNNLFKQETRLGVLFSIFTGLALFIACLGLIGLAAYMAEQRRKEISVRKVLGATVGQVMMLLSRDFARLLLIAFLIAIPFAWYTMEQWLRGFAYKVDVSPVTLITGGVAVVAVALLTVSYQSVRAALVNPVDSLKEE